MMSDNKSAAADSPIQQPAAQPDKSVEQPPEKPRVRADDLPPDALKARLEDAKRSAQRELLSHFGVTDVADVKAALEELRKRQDAEKSELERLRDQTAQLDGKAKKVDRYTDIITRRAMGEMESLTDSQRAAVKEIAGDDPAEQLRAVDILRKTWAAREAEQKQPDPPKPAPAANTAPPASAPADETVSPTDHKAVWKQLQGNNPFAATHYLAEHYAEIFPSR
jgi:hypothetical protein